MKPDEVIKPDAHLRAALHHAPDANDAAPADISAQIIAAAHRSAGVRAAPQVRAPAERGRWWLQPGGASGALATVLMAGVIGLMWRGEAPGPAREEKEVPPQVAQAPTPSPVRASTPTPVPKPVPAPATADALATPPTPAPTPQPVATQPRVLAAAPAVKPTTKPAAQVMAAEPSEILASARDAGAATVAAPPAPAPAPAPAPTSVAQAAPAPAGLAAPATPSAPSAQTAQTAQTAQAAPPPPPAAAVNLQGAQRAAQEQSAAAPAAMARLRAPAGASVAQQPPWRTAPLPGDALDWQPADRLLPPNAAWLARLAELSAGRWQPLSVTPSTAEVAQLHWQRSGATVARFGFDRSSVWWCSALMACERAPLDAKALRELLAQLAR